MSGWNLLPTLLTQFRILSTITFKMLFTCLLTLCAFHNYTPIKKAGDGTRTHSISVGNAAHCHYATPANNSKRRAATPKSGFKSAITPHGTSPLYPLSILRCRWLTHTDDVMSTCIGVMCCKPTLFQSERLRHSLEMAASKPTTF